MGIVPIEIGENYCLLGWRRVPRAPDTPPAISVIRGVGKVTAYELRVTRLDGKAKEKYEGPLSLDTVIPLESSVTSYHLGNLVSNTIYAVSMRAKAEGYWGPWSKVTKFVSQGRLQIKVHSVYEDVMLVSWSRPLPDWAHTRRDSNSMTNGESPPGSQADDPHEVDTLDQATTNTASTKLGSHDVRKGQDVSDNNSDAEDSNDWDAVQLGDYSIQRYELYLEGITCEMQQCLTLSKYQMSVRISGLQANQIYSVCVRSQSEKQHWSMLSRRESVLTLTPIATEVSHCTEDMAIIRWFRIRQDIKMYESFLEERRREEERICDERERHELFDMKRRLQELEDSEERDNLCDHLKLRHEHNAAVRMDAIHYLQIENIVQGDAETTGFHFRFYGGGVMPLIQGLNHMLLQSQCPKGSHGRKRRTDTSRSLNRTRRHHQRSSPEATGAYSMECAQITSLHIPAIQSEVTQAAGAADDGEEVGALGGRRTMFDVQLRSEVFSVTLKGLSPNSSFEVEVCTRNIAGDWCPWSERTRFSTLRPIELQQERFGEHYINLYWHRLPQSVSDEIESDERQLLELNEEFANMSPQDLKKKEQELSREDYEILLSRIKKLRDLKQSVQEKRSWLSSGQGEVVVHEHTPVKGYQLRVIHQNGTFQDYYVADKNDESADSAVRRAFTITGLVWNTMYTAILCCDYGVGWGPWTKPLKFVTQNLIQMSIMYISETFVDIEWRRAPNTRLPAINEGDTLRSDPASNEGRVCQVRITWEDEVEAKDGEAKIKEEYREMHSCCVFRVDKLLTDTKYTFEVREWGAQGDWGLWCAPKTCVTIPAMSVAVTKLGEDWAHITWNRLDRRVDYDNDINVLQHGVDNEIYYLRVAELQDNGIEGEDFQVPMVEEEEHTPATLVDDIAGVLTAQRNTYNSLPAQEHPVECETDGSGRFYLIRRFDKTISSYLVGNLRHDRFYSAQVVCVTTGGQLGSWSPEQYFLTMSRIQVEARHIDERYANIEWRRSPPRKHPRLSMASVFTGSYVTKEYIVELSGRDGFHLIGKLIGADSTEYQFENLSIDTVYKVAVSSVSEDDTHSLWSEPLRFVTLPRVTIYPTQITEHWITLEWGRGEQKPFGDEGTEYEGRHDPTIKVGSGLCSSYLLRIDQGGDGVKRLLEKQLPGNVNTFHLESLTPNTPYTINIRPANILGEWGFWSGERCVYTMKLIHVDVLATGEDYVRLHWGRGEPDELQTVDCVAYVSGNSSISSGDEERLEEDDGEHDGSEKSPTTVGESSRSVGEPSDDLFGSADSVTEAQPAAEDDGTFQNLTKGNEKALELKKLPLRKKYPLLDRPEKKSSMYNSTKTHITGYAITIIREGEDEGYTLDVPGGKTTFTVPSLLPDKRYLFAVRACYGGSDWGPISPHIACGTLNLLNVELTGLGEDYLTAAWQRLPNTFNVSEVTHMDQEELLCYELAVHDFTDVSLGEEDNEELPPRLRRAVMVPANVRRCTVRELLPHHRYRVSVRRWYKPHEAFLNNAPHSEFPQIEDDDVKEVLLREKAEAGAWSDGLYDVTMSEMVCFMDDGAEDFFAVRWERDTSALPLPVRNPFPQKPVDGYQLRVYDMGPIVSTLEGGEGLLLTDLTLSGADSTYTARNLRHDSLYRVHVRCCVDNVWGRWSRIVHVMTLPKFVVEMNSIGENYAEFSWQRPRRSLTLPDGSEAFCGNDDNLSMFQVEVAGIEHSYHINKQFKGVRNSYRAKMLEADTVYSVSVRAIDSRRDTWNPWNDRTYFVTLKPMRLVVYPPGEQFVTVEWFRDEQTVQDYADIVGVSSGHGPIGNSVDTFPVTSSPTTAAVPIHLGSPDVIAYHLCIFAGQHTPAVAVVDKQFPKDLNRYTVCSLDPDTPYVAVVRACNVDSRWGLWSKEGLFHTQCILKLSILRVGEIYATIKWERGEGDRQDEKHNPGKRLEPCEYQLLLKSGTETFERTVYPSDCGVTDEESLPTYMLGDLAPGSEYVMALQPRYDETRWGRWTHTVGFKTIYPIAVNVNEVAGNAVKFSVQRTLPPPTPIPSPTDAEKVEAKAKKNSKGGKGPRGAKTSRARRDSRLDKTGRGSPKTLESLPPVPVSQPPLSGRSPIPADSSAVSASTVSFVHGETPESPQKTVENEEPDDGSVDQKICIPVVKKYQVEVRVIERVREGNKALSDDGGSAANTPATVNTPCGVLAGSGGGRSGFGSPREIPQPVVLLPPITNITGGDSTTERIPGEGCGSQTPDTRAVATSEGGIYEDSALRSCYRVMLASTSQDRPHFRELMFDVEKDDPLVKIIEVDNLDYSTSYAIRIRAMDEHDMWGAWVETTIMTAPPPPRCVTLRRQNAQTCLLQWEAPDYHRRYRYVVEQSHYTTDSRGRCRGAIEWRVRDTVEETSCRVRLTAPPAKMRCRVKCALIGEDNIFSDYCEPVALTSGMLPDPVSGLVATRVSCNRVSLAWRPSRTETMSAGRSADRNVTYRIYVGVYNCTPILVCAVPDTTHTLEGLEPSKTYLSKWSPSAMTASATTTPLSESPLGTKTKGPLFFHKLRTPHRGQQQKIKDCRHEVSYCLIYP
uniref:Fibronectin type-III domain-containing protein n=1 Tax=Trypanosoma congolense (strain IL3000) TaxID=1068625 RepID=G0UTC5_TRYCI|nr:conserved hypothetical protein [Trypanosoma congolense IL3000]